MPDRLAAGCPLASLPPERLHLPFEAAPFRMAMGLIARPPDDVLEIDDRYPAEMAERRNLLATNRDAVFAATPGSAAARDEVLRVLAELLPRRYPDWFARAGTVLRNRLTDETWDLGAPSLDPLELAGRLVQEDLCIVGTQGPRTVLAAAVLCAPSRWLLHEKIGRPLAAVHAPVPLYADRLAAPVDRFMVALRPGKLAERFNWSLVDSGALFLLGGKHHAATDPSFTPDNVADRLFLRVERQTLVRLPESGAVLFTIRVHSYPLARVLAVPGAAGTLASAVEALPAAPATYKSLPAFRDALLARLRS